MTAKRVQIVGYYGMGNYGDDLFRDVVQEHSESIWPGASVRAWSPKKPGLNALPGRAGQSVRLGAAMAGAAWSDTFALCGGSVLHEISGVQSLRTRLAGRRTFEALGVSVGPFDGDDNQESVLSFLDTFERVIVRDEASNERCGGQWQVGGDLAALMTHLPAREPHSRVVTVCPSRASGVSAETLARQVHDSLGDTKGPIRLLALNYHPLHGDEVLCAETASLLRVLGHETVYTLSYRTLGLTGVTNALARSRAVVTQRLHAGIVSYLVGTPFVIVGHHAKCTDFAHDIGLSDDLVVEPEADHWAEGVQLALSETAPWSMSADEYRERARSIYLGAQA